VLTAATPRQLVWQLIQGRFIRILKSDASAEKTKEQLSRDF
jgi:hypothetical protein